MSLRTLLAPAAAGLLAASSVFAADAPASLETDDQKYLYAIGVALSQNLVGLDFTAEEISIINSGMADSLLGKEPKVDLPTIGPKIQDFVAQRAAEATEAEKAQSQKFVEAEAAKPGMVKTDSGAMYFEIAAGTGESPSASDTVRLHYHGTLRDGTVFDTSREGGEPAQFQVGGVIPCFSEGLQKMKVGGKGRLVCPSDTAYGDRGFRPRIKPGAALVFEVELLEIVETPPAAAAPEASPATPEEPVSPPPSPPTP